MTQELAFEGLGGALEGFRTGNEPEEMMEALLRLHFVGWRSRGKYSRQRKKFVLWHRGRKI